MPDIATATGKKITVSDTDIRVGSVSSLDPLVVSVSGADNPSVGVLGPVGSVGSTVVMLRHQATWMALGSISSPGVRTGVVARHRQQTAITGVTAAVTWFMADVPMRSGYTYLIKLMWGGNAVGSPAHALISVTPDPAALGLNQSGDQDFDIAGNGHAGYFEYQYDSTVDGTVTFTVTVQRTSGAGTVTFFAAELSAVEWTTLPATVA